MSEEQKRRTTYKRSKTRNELGELNRKLHLLDQPSQIEKNMLSGAYGLVRGQMRGANIQARRLERKAKLQAQKRLVEQELIKLDDKGDKILVSLTDRGRIEVLKQKVIDTKKELSKGKCCLVSYDIPEHVRNIRWVIRNLLKEAEFEIVHLSLWRSKKDVVNDLRALVKEIDAEDWVKVYLAEE